MEKGIVNICEATFNKEMRDRGLIFAESIARGYFVSKSIGDGHPLSLLLYLNYVIFDGYYQS